MIPKAIIGRIMVNNNCLFLVRLNALSAPAQRPIIMLPQYIEILGAISDEDNPPNSDDFSNSPKLLPIPTSTPTYINIANIPKTNCGYFMAPQPSGCADAFLYAKSNPPTITIKAKLSQSTRLFSSVFLSIITADSL